MKKYYCPTCKQFKTRFQLDKVDDTRVAFYQCKWCHSTNIYRTEDVIRKLVNKSLDNEDFDDKHGSWF